VSWEIRPATLAEVEAVLEVWRRAGAEVTSTDDSTSVATLMTRDPGALLVAVDEGRLVGTVIAGFDGWRAHLYRLAVVPEFRRRGVARALVAEAQTGLAGLGARRLDALVVGSHDHAVGFWEAAGFPADPRMVRHVRSIAAD
jgi:ribosomal protein S18 acetylase RimI-like enzyme